MIEEILIGSDVIEEVVIDNEAPVFILIQILACSAFLLERVISIRLIERYAS